MSETNDGGLFLSSITASPCVLGCPDASIVVDNIDAMNRRAVGNRKVRFDLKGGIRPNGDVAFKEVGAHCKNQQPDSHRIFPVSLSRT